jgi:hypothetical protein
METMILSVRREIRLTCMLFFASALLLSSCVGPSAPKVKTIPNLKNVVGVYSDVAFAYGSGETTGDAADLSQLKKTENSFRIQINALSTSEKSKWEVVAHNYVSTIKKLTGADISFVNDATHNVAIHILDSESLESQFPGYEAKFFCQAEPFSLSKESLRADKWDAIAIAIDVDKDNGRSIESCLRNYIPFLLGLSKQTSHINYSTWYRYLETTDPENPGGLQYPPVDQMIMKAHSDPRLTNGMDRITALPIFRQIIIGLWPEFMGEPAPVN